MPLKTPFKSVALDILAGFVALCALLAYLVVDSQNDLQLFALVTAVLYFLAGTLRGASVLQNSCLTGLLISLGGALPVILMRLSGMGMTGRGYLPLFIAFSLLLAVVGVETRRLLSRERRAAAALLASLVFVVAILVITAAIPSLLARWSSEQVNRVVPSFSFATLGGAPVTSTELSGRVIVLAFWATWCSPCRQELPELQKVYEHYRDNSNVAFYAVGGPWGQDTAEKESTFAKQIKLNLPLAFDSERTTREALAVGALPGLVILDRNGRIRFVHTGFDAAEHFAGQLSKEIGALVSE